MEYQKKEIKEKVHAYQFVGHPVDTEATRMMLLQAIRVFGGIATFGVMPQFIEIN